MTDEPTVTFDYTAVRDIIEAFNWTINQNGYVVHADYDLTHRNSDPVLTLDGDPIHIDDFGGVVKDPETGEPTPVRDDFNAISAAVEATQ